MGRQISRGLYGAIIVRAADDPLPASLPEKLLLLSDIRVNSRGSVIIPASISDDQGWEGNVMFVNGQILPTVALRSGEVQRWRLVNASVARFYRLALNGSTLPSGGTRSESLGQPSTLEFRVSDTGEGIPEEALERVFEKFAQVESRQAGRQMSTGLGLTFCKLAVEAHGGTIAVDSGDRGSAFWFELPG